MNRIHDDEVARSLGFRGGLVPGVDVYAYLCHLPVECWGEAWPERGTMRARFASPVYDGEQVHIEGSQADETVLELTLTDPTGTQCATARATLPSSAPPSPTIDDWPAHDPPPT